MVAYKQDKEYMDYVGHLIATPKVQKLGRFLIIITPHGWNIPLTYLIQAIKLRKSSDGMQNRPLAVGYYTISFSMTGEILSLIKVMLGFIHGLLSAMLRNSFNLIN